MPDGPYIGDPRVERKMQKFWYGKKKPKKHSLFSKLNNAETAQKKPPKSLVFKTTHSSAVLFAKNMAKNNVLRFLKKKPTASTVHTPTNFAKISRSLQKSVEGSTSHGNAFDRFRGI